MSENTSTQVTGLLGLLALGAVIGAAVAMLYAPKTGKDTRDFLASRARDLKDKAVETLEDAKERVMGKKEELKAAISSRV
jgi:gas vesicle protein